MTRWNGITMFLLALFISFYLTRDNDYIKEIISPENVIWKILFVIWVILIITWFFILIYDVIDEEKGQEFRDARAIHIRDIGYNLAIIVLLFPILIVASLILSVLIIGFSYRALSDLNIPIPEGETTFVIISVTTLVFIALFINGLGLIKNLYNPNKNKSLPHP